VVPKHFYVYALIDPRKGKKGAVFYIGKGTWRKGGRERNQDHLRESISGKHCNPYLQNKIKKIVKSGLVYCVDFLFSADSEDECFAMEVYWIEFYGRKTLCNLTDGGEGMAGYVPSEESIRKNREATQKSGPRLSNTSGFKGVVKRKGMWRSHILHKGHQLYLGTFKTKEGAARAYDEAARKYWGEFAYRNFPKEIHCENVDRFTMADAMRSAGVRRDSVSGFKGVTKSSNKWSSDIKANGKHLCLGKFATKEEAAQAYDIAARKYFGDGCYLNYPERVDMHAKLEKDINDEARRKAMNTASGYKGVVYNKGKRTDRPPAKPWVSIMYADNKHIHIGQFLTKEQAASAYDKAARERFGERAFQNFPTPS
jgi:hypothetical protein